MKSLDVLRDRRRSTDVYFEDSVLNRWKKFILENCLTANSIKLVKENTIPEAKDGNPKAKEIVNFCNGLERDVKYHFGLANKPDEFNLTSYRYVN